MASRGRPRRPWSAAELLRLGVESDRAIAVALGIHQTTVSAERRRRRLQPAGLQGPGPRAGAVAETRVSIRLTPRELARWRALAGSTPLGVWIRDTIAALTAVAAARRG